MRYDAIDHLACCGYSEREAAFLYIVAVHSGYFLRRQFNRFVVRERGAIATHFLHKARELGHVVGMACSDGRLIYHLSNKQIYRLAGLSGSQSCRVKSSREMLRRLISLDYVLLHLGHERFLETRESRVSLYTQFKIQPEFIECAETFGHRVPVSFADDTEPATVRFAFIDEGQRSIAMFARFLVTHGKLLRSLPRAEVVYVSTAPAQFVSAQRIFERNMPLGNSTNSACPHGVDHLIHWLEVQHRFYEVGGRLQPSEHLLLLEGEHLYTAPVHKGLVASWKNGAMDASKVRDLFRAEAHRLSFVTELLDTSYPQILDPTPGYNGGYDDSQKTLFHKDIKHEKEAGQKC